jgi:large subunit ribosomal protein L9
LGHEISKAEVVMGEGPIRTVGEFDVIVHLHADVETKVKVIVTPEE